MATNNEVKPCTTENAGMTPLTYRLATVADCESLIQLVNDAYCNDSLHEGWTSIKNFYAGKRTDQDVMMSKLTDDDTAILLFFELSSNTLIGCIALENKANMKNISIGDNVEPETDTQVKKAELGMLCVRPDLQNRGYGKFIISIAENFAVHHWHINTIEMSVLIYRTELINFYIRRGYIDTYRRHPPPESALRLGAPKRDDLEYCVLSKTLDIN